jgi:hypothetical protein
MNMAEIITTAANIRILGEDKKSACAVSGVLPTVTAEKAAAFVSAIAALRNNGDCTATLRTTAEIGQ